MDQATRRIVGLAVRAGVLGEPATCCLFNEILSRSGTLPKSLSTDNDALFRFHRWKTNLRLLEIHEIKSVPDVPLSHSFVERLIGSIHSARVPRSPALLDFPGPRAEARGLHALLQPGADASILGRDNASALVARSCRHPFNTVAKPLPRSLPAPRCSVTTNSHPTPRAKLSVAHPNRRCHISSGEYSLFEA